VRVKLGIALALVVATFAAYQDVRSHDFVDFDDWSGIVANPDLRVEDAGEALRTAFTTTLRANWIPATVLSLQLDHRLFGGAPRGTLLTNVALHAAAAVVLFLALTRLTGGPWSSAFVAGVFALHPLHVESVAWASMRKDVLSGLCFALCLLAYARYAEHPGRLRYAGVALFLALGLLAKPVLVTVPFVLLLLDWWPLGRLRRPSERRLALLEKLPLLALSAGASAVTLIVQDRAGAVRDRADLAFVDRLANAVHSYAMYLADAFWPRGLAVFHPHPGDSLTAGAIATSTALLLGVTAVAVARARSRAWLLVGWLWFLGMLVPMLGLVQVGMQARADRYTYLPLIGLTIAVAWSAAEAVKGRRPARVAVSAGAVVVLAALGVATSQQVRHWRDAVTLHQRVVAVTAPSTISYQRLALALRRSGRGDEAVPVLERAIELGPNHGRPYLALADLRARAGVLEEAVELYRQGLAREPDDALGQANLGLALVRLKRLEEARPHLERALALHDAAGGGLRPKELAAPHVALADALAGAGDLDAAIAHYERARALDSEQSRAAGHLGFVLAQTGRYSEALPVLQEAVASEPGSARYRAALASSLANTGRAEEALAEFRIALRLRPRWRPAANDLAWILATHPDPRVRDPQEALRLIESVLLDPETQPALLDTLAAALAATGRFEEALATADRALSLADRQPGLAAEIRRRRALYATGRPYLDEPAPTDPEASALVR
jgi:tetratricopeptide (TPR) repeat protein